MVEGGRVGAVKKITYFKNISKTIPFLFWLFQVPLEEILRHFLWKAGGENWKKNTAFFKDFYDFLIKKNTYFKNISNTTSYFYYFLLFCVPLEEFKKKMYILFI